MNSSAQFGGAPDLPAASFNVSIGSDTCGHFTPTSTSREADQRSVVQIAVVVFAIGVNQERVERGPPSGAVGGPAGRPYSRRSSGTHLARALPVIIELIFSTSVSMSGSKG